MVDKLAQEVWNPDLMGYPVVEGYGYSTGADFAGFNVADGYTEFGLNILDAPSVLKMTFLMGPDQFEYFESWWRWSLSQGSRWFQMPVRSAFGLVTLAVHEIGEGYSANYIHGSDGWEVSFNVEMGYGKFVRSVALPLIYNSTATPVILNSVDGNSSPGALETNSDG